MKRDHFAFSLFLILMLIAPKVPLSIGGAPSQSSASLGFIGLVVWAMLSPNHLIRIVRPNIMITSVTLVAFGFYALYISLLSSNIVSMLYAAQYLFYLLFGFVLL